MGKIALAWDDKLQYSDPVITASSARPAFPAPNVASAQPSEVWRTNDGVTSANVLVDLTVSRTVNSVFLGSTNLTSAATWRIRLSSADATGVAGNIIDTGTVATGLNTTERCTFRIVGPGSGRYLRVDFTDTTVPYIEVGVLAAYAALWRPPFNFQLGAKRLFKDFSQVREGPDGQQRVRRGSTRSGVVFTLPAIAATELRTLAVPMARYAGIGSEVCACLDPDDTTDIGYQTFRGLLEEPPEFDLFMTKYSRAAYRVWRRL